MRKLTALVDHHLTWIQQSGLRSQYELRFGDELVATLRFPKMLSTRAILESGEGNWIIERTGFFNAKTVVRQVDSEKDLAVFSANVWRGGGVLEISEGRTLEVRTNAWRTVSQLLTASGEQLVETKGRGFFRFSADVTMAHQASQWPELPWMVAMMFYVMIMSRRDSAAHAGAH
jgi:hypothetical protein